MFILRSTRGAACCLVLACAALLPAAGAADLQLKPLQLKQPQTLQLPKGTTLPGVPKPAEETGLTKSQKLAKTKLEVTRDSGEFADWQPKVTLAEARKYSFRWTTALTGFAAAEWQVGQGDTVLASGAINGGPFKGNRQYQFTIDLKQVLPGQPPAQPAAYWVRVVPQGAAASSAVALTYTKGGGKGGQTPTFGFDFDRFAYNLTTLMQDKAIGWEFAIYDGITLKASGAGGFAKLSPKKPMSADTRMNIASPSKTITTAAVMRAFEILKAKGKIVTLDAKIAPYLPTGWAKGPHVDEITIKDLLRHGAGFTRNFELYEDLRAMIADGPENWERRYTDGIMETYNNSNFMLLRIILPYIVYGREAIEGSPAVAAQVAAIEAEIAALQAELKTASPAEKPLIAAQIKQLQKQKAALPGQPGESVEVRTAKLYVQFVQKEVLAKVGLGNTWINPRSPSEAITFYNFKNPSKTFAGFTDDMALRSTGASYWFMSAKEYGRFVAGLRNGKIVSASSYKTMHDAQIGMFYLDSVAGDARHHNGRYTFDNKSGMRSAWVAFPNGVTAVLFMNSYNPELDFPQETLREAFNAAFKMQQLAAR